MPLFSIFKKKSLGIYPIIEKQGFLGFGDYSVNWSDENPENFVNTVPELKSIITQQTQMMMSLNFKIVNKSTQEEVDIFKNPNPFQTKNEFFSNFYNVLNLYDNAFIYIDSYNTKFSAGSQVYIFSISDLKFKLNDDLENLTNYKDIIKSVSAKVIWNKKEKILDKEKLFFLNRAGFSSMDILFGANTMLSAKRPLSNLLAIYESENKLLTHRGFNGILTPVSSKDGYGTFSGDDKEEIEKSLNNNFGLVNIQKKYLVSSRPVDFIKTTFSPVELGLNDSRIRNKIALNDLFGHSILLTNEMDGATFANYKSAKSFVYENKIIPDAVMIKDFFNSTIFNNTNFELIFDDNEVKSLSIDKKTINETNLIKTQIIINLNIAITNNQMTKENAIEMLLNLGYEIDIAKKLIKNI